MSSRTEKENPKCQEKKKKASVINMWVNSATTLGQGFWIWKQQVSKLRFNIYSGTEVENFNLREMEVKYCIKTELSKGWIPRPVTWIR